MMQKTVALADPAQRVPWPGVPGRLLPPERFSVNPFDPFWAALIRDGTLIEPPANDTAPEPAPKPAKAKA